MPRPALHPFALLTYQLHLNKTVFYLLLMRDHSPDFRSAHETTREHEQLVSLTASPQPATAVRLGAQGLQRVSFQYQQKRVSLTEGCFYNVCLIASLEFVYPFLPLFTLYPGDNQVRVRASAMGRLWIIWMPETIS